MLCFNASKCLGTSMFFVILACHMERGYLCKLLHPRFHFFFLHVLFTHFLSSHTTPPHDLSCCFITIDILEYRQTIALYLLLKRIMVRCSITVHMHLAANYKYCHDHEDHVTLPENVSCLHSVCIRQASFTARVKYIYVVGRGPLHMPE